MKQNQTLLLFLIQHNSGWPLFMNHLWSFYIWLFSDWFLNHKGMKKRIFWDCEASPRWILGYLKGSHRCTCDIWYWRLTNDVEMKQSVQIRGENCFLIDTIYTNWSETNKLHSEGVMKRLGTTSTNGFTVTHPLQVLVWGGGRLQTKGKVLHWSCFIKETGARYLH